MGLSISTSDDSASIRIDDSIERVFVRFDTNSEPAIERADPDRFTFPVSQAWKVSVDRLRLFDTPPVYIREPDGSLTESINYSNAEKTGAECIVEICTPIKIYLEISGSVAVTQDNTETAIEFSPDTSINLGARSKHTAPEATITISESPSDLLEALSYMGTGLKSHSPERSFSTLRGHPPLIEVGDALTIPGELERPETGVRIEIPEQIRYAFPAASLAYYLGADVKSAPDAHPRLRTEHGFEYPLTQPSKHVDSNSELARYEQAIAEVLQQTFLLDCLTRTEGLYPLDLYERTQLEPELDLDFEQLYNTSLQSRLEAYLSTEFETIQNYLPTWMTIGHVAPSRQNIAAIPHLVNDLAIIKSPKARQATRSDNVNRAVTSFVRGEADAKPGLKLVKPEPEQTQNAIWFDEGAPIGGTKGILEAYRNRVEVEARPGALKIAVVCNEESMKTEFGRIKGTYGADGLDPIETDYYNQITVSELTEVFTSEYDFVHFIGHIQESGFNCSDGRLNVSEVTEPIQIRTFLLNGCRSYTQGVALLRQGAIAGVVTTTDVVNNRAADVGDKFSTLLNRGFSLNAATSIIDEVGYSNDNYITIGDGLFNPIEPTEGAPIVWEIEPVGDKFQMDGRVFCNRTIRIGAMGAFHSSDDQLLIPGRLVSLEASIEELEEMCQYGPETIVHQGELTIQTQSTIRQYLES